MRGRKMNCWTAFVRIVESFNRKDRPGYALCALFLIVVMMFGLALLANGLGSALLPYGNAALRTITTDETATLTNRTAPENAP